MGRKRTGLDSLFSKPSRLIEPSSSVSPPPAASPGGKRPGVKQQTVYLPAKIHEQLRRLAFEERAKMHDYFMEGLDLVFAKRGLPSIGELLSRRRDAPKD